MSNTFEKSIKIAQTLIPLLSIERHVSIIFRRTSWLFLLIHKRIDLSINQFFKYIWEIRKDTNRLVVILVFCITTFSVAPIFTQFLKIRVSVRVYVNRTDHDFNLNVFKSTDFISVNSWFLLFCLAIKKIPNLLNRLVLELFK